MLSHKVPCRVQDQSNGELNNPCDIAAFWYFQAESYTDKWQKRARALPPQAETKTSPSEELRALTVSRASGVCVFIYIYIYICVCYSLPPNGKHAL